jgi:predicted N-acetyltransferase YhbS
MMPEYLADADVDAAQDEKIRTLLTACFTKPQDVIFKERRYFHEPYPHRWIIKDRHGAFIAHIGVHDKCVKADGKTYRIAGIAEVCVHPDHRGHGYVRAMLLCIHDWLMRQGVDFAMLFGDRRVYSSSGYVLVDNLFHDVETVEGQIYRKQLSAMVKELSGTPWPGTEVHLPGPVF